MLLTFQYYKILKDSTDINAQTEFISKIKDFVASNRELKIKFYNFLKYKKFIEIEPNRFKNIKFNVELNLTDYEIKKFNSTFNLFSYKSVLRFMYEKSIDMDLFLKDREYTSKFIYEYFKVMVLNR